MATNDYFDHPNSASRLSKGTKARSDGVNSIFDSVTSGFDKIPDEADFNQGTHNYAGTSTGSSNAYAVTLTHVSGSYVDGQKVIFTSNHTNTGASTLNVSSISDTAIVTPGGEAILASSLTEDSLIEVRYSSTLSAWVLQITALTAGTALTTTITDTGNNFTGTEVETALSETVTKANTQTITGDKTLSGSTTFSGNVGLDSTWDIGGTAVTSTAAQINDLTELTDLASTANGDGAALVGLEDSAGYFTATTVEAALAEILNPAIRTKIQASSSQSVPTSPSHIEVMEFDTATIDTLSELDTVTSVGRVTPDNAGYYHVHVYARSVAEAYTAGFQNYLTIRKNGGFIMDSVWEAQATGTFTTSQSAACVIYCNGSTDYIDVTYQNGSSTAATVQGDLTVVRSI